MVIVTLYICNVQICLQGMTNNVRFTFSVSDYMGGLQLVLSKTNRVGDTKCIVECNKCGLKIHICLKVYTNM